MKLSLGLSVVLLSLSGCGNSSLPCGACPQALTVQVDIGGSMVGGEAMVQAIPLDPESAPVACDGELPVYLCPIGPGRYRLEVRHPAAGDFTTEITIVADGGGMCSCGYVPQTIEVSLGGSDDGGSMDASVDAGTG